MGIFEGEELIATALFQEIDLALLNSFGERDHFFLTEIRNFLFKRFASKLLIVGNNMLSGQNAYACLPHADEIQVVEKLKEICHNWPQKTHLTIFKDFTQSQTKPFQTPAFSSDYPFSSQPNMIFEILPSWKKEEDYVADLAKKYRDQFKRCRKKGSEIRQNELSLEEILQNEQTIYSLYLQVAKNSPFNTFILPSNHFSTFKQNLGDNFILRGYFLDNQLVGFTSLIRHGKELETYFLGFDNTIQREKMLYLNMLYDIVGCGIAQGFERIILGRTALEIKSSIGATPHELWCYVRHQNSIANKFTATLLDYLKPVEEWLPRHPFKEEVHGPNTK